jgi:NADPH-dependent 2,4-dienoyl-CoA reductase/sulfur reductase-like enzyme/nitrite reductase/ring-hydroxylating ferredoxin subunit
MSSSQSENTTGPDLTLGIPLSLIPADGVFVGHVGDDRVLLARVDGAVVALNASCSHYGGPLHAGLRVGNTINCPWHHACFDLRTGAALKAPALSPLGRWRVEEKEGFAFVREALSPAGNAKRDTGGDPASIVIVGGGAAGFAAAQRLRELGYAGELTLVSADEAAPYDRPNVSKDYLAGTAEPEWMPLKDAAFYRDNKITLRTATRVESVNAAERRIALASGETLAYGVLLLATGAEPNRPATSGFERDNVYVLRSLQDADRLVNAAAEGSTVAIIGSSFIGLEAAASLRVRGLSVHVVGREAVPLESKLGSSIGALIKSVHEQNGVQFHLGRSIENFDGRRVKLDDGSSFDADIVVLGVGVTPRLELAVSAGLAVDKGVLVDASMRSSDPHIYVAGDIARFPNPLGGAPIRVEHWVLAERLGQVAAHGMLGIRDSFKDPPFFWSVHWDVTIRYVGHADTWDAIEEAGVVAEKDAEVRYIKDGTAVAVATINRDLASLEAAQFLADRANA